MVRAILKNGVFELIDPIPPDWRDGEILRVSLDLDRIDDNRLQAWLRELQTLSSQIPPADHARMEEVLFEKDRVTKELMRREMETDGRRHKGKGPGPSHYLCLVGALLLLVCAGCSTSTGFSTVDSQGATDMKGDDLKAYVGQNVALLGTAHAVKGVLYVGVKTEMSGFEGIVRLEKYDGDGQALNGRLVGVSGVLLIDEYSAEQRIIDREMWAERDRRIRALLGFGVARQDPGHIELVIYNPTISMFSELEETGSAFDND